MGERYPIYLIIYKIPNYFQLIGVVVEENEKEAIKLLEKFVRKNCGLKIKFEVKEAIKTVFQSDKKGIITIGL